MKKVIIRRKEVLGHLPKEIRAGAKISIGSIYVGRQPLKGVEGEEAHRLLGEILDVPPGHEQWPRQEKDFWASMRLKVPFEGKELDITTDDSGHPMNAMDYVTYQWCKKHRQVAESKEEMQRDSHKKFYIYDPQRDLLKKNAKVKVQKEADKEFIKVSTDVEKMKRVLRVLNKGTNPNTLSNIEVENTLYEVKTANPAKFLKVVIDKDLDLRAEIEELASKDVLRKIGNQYIYGDETIGENITDTIVYFKNKKNSGAVNAMRAQLKSLA
ncbi:hypothetical protein OAA26_00240 [bacterium]|nr:hypothetical protein [bacterium]|tara:strand:- start:7032 stop:7838 length:807 start_codon:yes stop_codon:yes gene_type:complete